MPGTEHRPGDPQLWKEIGQIHSELVVGRCAFERLPYTNELAWRAPQNFGFRVTEQFFIDYDKDGGGMSDWGHKSSQELLKAEYPEEYSRFLKTSRGNQRSALKRLLEMLDYYDDGIEFPPTEFRGKWLVISPNIDGSESESNWANPVPALRIKDKIDARYDEFLSYVVINNINSDPENPLQCAYREPAAAPTWRQRYAQLVLGSSRVQLVEMEEPKEELLVSDPVDHTKIEVAVVAKPFTSRDHADYYANAGFGWSEAEREVQVREMRAIGLHYADDPLKDFVFLSQLPSPLIIPEKLKLMLPGDSTKKKIELEF